MADQINDFFKEAEKEVNAQTEGSNKEYDEVWSKENVSLEEAFDNSQTENNENKDQNVDDDVSIDNVQTEQPKQTETKQESNNEYITLTKPLKYRGKEIYPKTEDELIELAQKGLDYSFKMNKIAPYRELIDVSVKYNVNATQLEEILSNMNNVESEPIVDESIFDSDNQDQSFGPVDAYQEVMPILERQNKQLASKVNNIYRNIDDAFKYELNDRKVFEAFVGSISSGEFERVYNKVVEAKKANPFMTWLETYSNVANGVQLNKQTLEPGDAIQQQHNKKGRNLPNQNKTIKEQYNEVWEKELSIDQLEKLLIEGV